MTEPRRQDILGFRVRRRRTSKPAVGNPRDKEAAGKVGSHAMAILLIVQRLSKNALTKNKLGAKVMMVHWQKALTWLVQVVVDHKETAKPGLEM